MQMSGVFFQTAVLQIVRLITGVCRAKLIALFLGPAGIGIFAQAQNLQSLLLAVGSLSLATGYVQRIRYLSGRYTDDYRQQVHGTVFITIFCALVLVLAGLTPFLPWLEAQAFSGSVPPGFSWYVLWSIPLLSLAQIYFEPRLIASDLYGNYVKAMCASSVLGVPLLWGVLKYAGIESLSIYLFATAALSCVFMGYFVVHHEGGNALLPRGWRWSHLRPILKVSFALVVTGIAFYGTAVWLRALVMKNLGAGYAGLIQVPIVMSGYYAPLLSHIIWNIYHVKLSENYGTANTARILNAAIAFVAIVQPLITLWIMTFPGIAVGLIYSNEFRHSINTFPMQFLGDFFYFLLTVISVQMLAANKIRLYLALWIAYSAVEFGAGTYFILEQKLALRSLALAHLVASVAALVLFFWPAIGSTWKARRYDFRIAARAFLFGLFFLVVQALLLREDADLPFRFSVATLYSGVIAYIAWKHRTDDWNARFNRLTSAFSRKSPPNS